MQLLKNGGPLPRELVTKKSLENACAAVAATGGSTNAALHIPAIAHEAGIRFTLDDFARVAKRTPLIADMKPGGRFLAKDLHAVGGVYAVLKELLTHGALHGDCLTLVGTTLEKALAEHPGADGEVVRKEPIMKTGGLVVLKGNLAPDGALIKVAGLKSLVFEGRARVFDSEESCAEVDRRKELQGRRSARDPLRRPEGRAGHARDARRHRADLRAGHGREGRAAHRRALLRRDARHDDRLRLAGSRGRRAARAGAERRPHPHRRRRGELRLEVAASELKKRKASAPKRSLSGVLEKYEALVGSGEPRRRHPQRRAQ